MSQTARNCRAKIYEYLKEVGFTMSEEQRMGLKKLLLEYSDLENASLRKTIGKLQTIFEGRKKKISEPTATEVFKKVITEPVVKKDIKYFNSDFLNK